MSVKGWNKQIAKVEALMRDTQTAPEKAAKEWLEKDYKPYAKQIAPKDTGAFADSIDGRVTADSVTVFADAPHSRYVEEGTSTHRAQPTIKPAFDRTKHKLAKRIAAEIKKVTR